MFVISLNLAHKLLPCVSTEETVFGRRAIATRRDTSSRPDSPKRRPQPRNAWLRSNHSAPRSQLAP